ncbi:MAG TPA: DUF2283 domain-containing protein [Verrucomicrobiota bacterium]|nr:DUF2283 domain-containing protein [Verrucomicrobiota bacterium]HRT06864.1 DUF2283 domain-containing protein [Candidatus Paceibacterota bacterium]HRT55312.1 DUF2283 domain-containing protein [Candidatus Paceibacterota bacterium]
MAEVKVCHEPNGHTMTLWFGRPEAEYRCGDTGEEMVLMKDRKGWVSGFERLNYRGNGRLGR